MFYLVFFTLLLCRFGFVPYASAKLDRRLSRDLAQSGGSSGRGSFTKHILSFTIIFHRGLRFQKVRKPTLDNRRLLRQKGEAESNTQIIIDQCDSIGQQVDKENGAGKKDDVGVVGSDHKGFPIRRHEIVHDKDGDDELDSEIQ